MPDLNRTIQPTSLADGSGAVGNHLSLFRRLLALVPVFTPGGCLQLVCNAAWGRRRRPAEVSFRRAVSAPPPHRSVEGAPLRRAVAPSPSVGVAEFEPYRTRSSEVGTSSLGLEAPGRASRGIRGAGGAGVRNAPRRRVTAGVILRAVMSVPPHTEGHVAPGRRRPRDAGLAAAAEPSTGRSSSRHDRLCPTRPTVSDQPPSARSFAPEDILHPGYGPAGYRVDTRTDRGPSCRRWRETSRRAVDDTQQWRDAIPAGGHRAVAHRGPS